MPILLSRYEVYDDTASSSTLTAPAFVPDVDELIVVKAVSSSAVQTMGTPTGGGWTYTNRVMDGTASHCRVAIWTAPVTSGGTSTTVALTHANTTVPHSMVVERWQFAAIDPSPVTVDTRGSGAPSTTLTTEADDSVVTWACGDWAAVDGSARLYNTTSAAPQEDGYKTLPGSDYTAYYAWQTAVSAASQTLGLTNPSGQTWTLAGIELLDFGSEVQLDPLPQSLVTHAPGRVAPAGAWSPMVPVQEGGVAPDPIAPTISTAVAAVLNTTGTSPATTAAFTVAAGTGLVALVNYNSLSATALDHTVSGAGLTWTLAGRKSRSAGSLGGAGTDGGAEIWWAYSAAGFTAQTVTCTWTSGTSAHTALKVLTITGGQAEVLGAVAAATSSAGQVRVQVPQTQPQSVIVASISDWSQKGTPIPGASQTAADVNDIGTAYTGWWERRTNPDPVLALHVLEDLVNARNFNVVGAEILGAVAAGGGATNAPAELADSTYAAGDPTAATTANTGSADLTVAALDPTPAVAVQAECATWSAAALDSVTSVGVQAENAAATFTSNDSTVTTATATNAPAEVAAWTVAAGDPAAAIAVQAECATWTLAAQTPTPAIAPSAEGVAWSAAAGDATVSTATATNAPAEAANWSAAAGDPLAAVAANAECATWAAVAVDSAAAAGPQSGVATWTASGQDPAASVAPQPAEATLTAAGQDAAAAVATNADVAPATFAALDPTITTGAVVNAPAEVASWTLASQDPTLAVAVNAECATWAAAALDPATQVGVQSGVATWTATAQDPAAAVSPAAELAAWTATAQDASTAVQANADVAPWTTAANDSTVTLGGNIAVQAECATWSMPAQASTVDVSSQAGLPAWTLAANLAATAQMVAADLAAWTLLALDASIPVQFSVGSLATTSQLTAGMTAGTAAAVLAADAHPSSGVTAASVAVALRSTSSKGGPA